MAATASPARAAPVLTPVFTHPGGEVLDADATRVLYVDAGGVLRVRDRASGSEVAVAAITSTGLGRLTSTGAYVASIDGLAGCPSAQALWAWTGSGPPVEIDRACSAVDARWRFAGDWAVRQDTPVVFARRNLATGAADVATFPTVSTPPRGLVDDYDIGDTGDVYGAWTSGTGASGYTYYRERAGTLASFAENTGRVSGFAGSGDAYVYANCLPTGTPCATTRCLGLRTDCVTLPIGLSVEVQLVGGWAFGDGEDTSIVSTHRIGRLGPTGSADEVGAQGDVLETAAAGGALTVRRGSDRYLVRADGSEVLIDPFEGRARFLPDALYLLIDDTLYRVDDGPPPIDAGPGGSDAGSDAATAGADGGADAASATGGGGGCAAGPAPSLAVALAALGLARRRRRR